MMEMMVQEALFYITGVLCTLLVILVSYRWLSRQPEDKAEEKKEDDKRKETTQEETEETPEDEKQDMPTDCPFGFAFTPAADETQETHPDKSQENISDLLIDSSDIQPLNDEERKKLEEDSASIGSRENEAMLDHKRVKELQEEVVKSMSEQQLEDEQKARQTQLEAIFNLMQDNKERFGMTSVDDVQNQYKLYV